jgi:hypothetical protein
MKTERRLVTDADAEQLRRVLAAGGDDVRRTYDLLDTREELIAVLERTRCRRCGEWTRDIPESRAILAQVRGENHAGIQS